MSWEQSRAEAESDEYHRGIERARLVKLLEGVEENVRLIAVQIDRYGGNKRYVQEDISCTVRTVRGQLESIIKELRE